MNPVELIRKKRNAQTLSNEELAFLVNGFSNGSIPDYQISAFLMAVYFQGMNGDETLEFTTRMKESGKSYAWPSNWLVADKHSTGGVGDKVSLVLAPIAAALGLKVPMMSGRSLGHTGGTVDKLESIPGFTVYPDAATLQKTLETVGCAMISQTADVCPADKKLYSLRDVTATVESIPLIAGSIVSKKWAAGVSGIVYDVKYGPAAFMEDVVQAKKLAQELVRVSQKAGMKASAALSRMDEPLGSRIGNAGEVEECAWILRRSFPSENHKRLAAPLVDLSLELCAELLCLASGNSFEHNLKQAQTVLENGRAAEVFEAMLKAQGAAADWFQRLPRPTQWTSLSSPKRGWVERVNSKALALVGLNLGMGRTVANAPIQHAPAFELLKAPGDFIEVGEPWIRVGLDHSLASIDRENISKALVLCEREPAKPTPLILEWIRG